MAGADDLRPLDAAIDEIRILHEAADRAAERIAAETRGLSGSSGAEGLVADVAEALVARTESMREDCERLDALLQRARAALAVSVRAPVARRPEPSAPRADITPGFAEPLPPVLPGLPVPAPSYSATPERRAAPKDPPSWQFWRRARRTERPDAERPLRTPPRLPRLDYTAPGVGSVVRSEDLAANARTPVPEGVRLVATQMAIAGSSRIEIERRLQKQFGIANAGPALDELFGLGSGTAAE